MRFPESNTPKLLLIATLQAFTLYAAFEKIFFQENGLSIIEIALLTLVFSVTLILLEVPSGALSDRWIRKHVLALSVLSLIVSLILIATGETFLQFALGVFFNGLAFVLNSGTNTSLLFDSLKENDATDSFEKYLATRRILSGVGFATASLLGGWIANQYGIVSAIWMTLIGLVPALLLCLSLREPSFHKTTDELTYFKHIGYTAKHLTQSTYFLNVIMLSVVIMATHILIEDYAQLYYFAVGFSLLAVGALSFIEGLKEMLANYIGSFMSRLSHLPLLYGLLLLVMSASLLMSAVHQSIVGVAGLLLASAVFFMIDVPLVGNFHRKLDSSIRATSESFMNLATELSKMLLAVAFATIANAYSIPYAFGALGLFVLAYTIYYWAFVYRVFASEAQPE